MSWILLVLTYGLIKGFREILKKKALETSTALEVLFLYTFISFILVLPEMKDAFHEEISTLLIVALKSFCIFLAWIFGFNSIQHIPVSLYGLLDLSRVIFSTALGVILLNESMGFGEILGCLLVCLGLLLLKFKPHSKKEASTESSDEQHSTGEAATIFIIFSLLSALLNGVSGTMDKLIMTRTTITDGHLQFWYMLFLVLFYLILVLICKIRSRPKQSGMNHSAPAGPDAPDTAVNTSSLSYQMSTFNLKKALRNYWIYILAIIFVIADRCLFIANADPDSKVTIMTLIKQSCCIVTILAGKIIFHEKNIIRKLICAVIIISGIMVSILM